MVQRIQTLYILAALAGIIVLFTGPVMEFMDSDNVAHYLWLSGIRQDAPMEGLSYLPFWPLVSLASISAVLLFVALFLYKKRMVQLRLVLFSTILLIGLFFFLIFYIYQTGNLVEIDKSTYSFRIVLPLVSGIFSVLAIRGIRKDELLVTMYKRIR